VKKIFVTQILRCSGGIHNHIVQKMR